ncbi:MAG: hypothetical protein JXB47_13230 [Anaerolineae bacterium]|nr:hypothetical protein [Anaerolineae bacterium]
MITRRIVLNKLLAYLNRETTLQELVAWSEDVIMDEDFDPAETDILMDIVGYLGAADSPGFELTWEVCYDFLTRLGSPVKVVPVAAA